MKTPVLISALMFAGVAMASPKATLDIKNPIAISVQQERVKIEAETLPEAVKKAIQKDEKVKDLQIKEAYQISQPDGRIHYEVVFIPRGEEKVTKKYDQDGNEIKD